VADTEPHFHCQVTVSHCQPQCMVTPKNDLADSELTLILTPTVSRQTALVKDPGAC